MMKKTIDQIALEHLREALDAIVRIAKDDDSDAIAKRIRDGLSQFASLSVILCARHNERQGAYYAEQIEESRP